MVFSSSTHRQPVSFSRCLSSIFNQNSNFNNIRLKTIDCKPEGYGIYKAYPGDRVAVLIMGHSDSSWLYFNNGMLNSKLSRTLPETGMHDFIRTLSYPITNELRAAELLCQAGDQLNPTILAELTQTKSDVEIRQLQQAIKEANAQYWVDRRSEFSSLNVSDVKLTTTSGGAAHYFSRELNQLFKELFGVHLHWGKALMLEFLERFRIKRKSVLLHRFADCYGYYRTLPGVEQYQVKAVEVIGGGKNA